MSLVGLVGLVDMDDWWREITSVALVGTGRRVVPPVPAGLPARAAVGPEVALLDALAVAGTVRRVGLARRREAGEGPAAGAGAAPPDARPVAPATAVQLLELLLHQPPAGTDLRQPLLTHWLVEAHVHRAPHALLPALLDLGTERPALRAALRPVLDRRGPWLAGMRDDWEWARDPAGPDAADRPDPAAWARLPLADRVAELRHLRSLDPPAGRALVEQGWSRDGAKDRLAHLQALTVGLADGDEPFLEAALDDRAASVRALAADLLDGVPGSRRGERLAGRLRPLLTVERGALHVALPGRLDEGARRDGLGGPPPGRSARGWALERLVAGAPFEVLLAATGRDVAATVAGLDQPDALAGLRRAAVARSAADWAVPLLARAWDVRLIEAVPAGRRLAVADTLLDQVPDVGALAALVAAVPPPWSAAFGDRVLGRLARERSGGTTLSEVARTLAERLHPDSAGTLARWGSRPGTTPLVRRRLRELQQFLSVKQSISEAFR